MSSLTIKNQFENSQLTRKYVSLILCSVILINSGCNRTEPVSGDVTAKQETKPNSADENRPADDGSDKKDSTDDKRDSQAKKIDADGGATPPRKHGGDHADAKRVHTKEPNRLAKETSPYLLLHAHNPVDWYPWGPEALAKAKRENKIIFLSIGYSSCYWCHVMERLVFSNPEIAKYMNEHFINIKVDREERPDIDDIYMTSLQVYLQLSGAGGGGGWPLSMFLTPEGKPIVGGTYFPPEDTDHRLGFPTVMKRLAGMWKNKKDELEKGANTITEIVQREMRPGGLLLQQPKIDRELVATVVNSVVQSHDAEYGGVDFQFERPNSPKFPVPTKLSLLLYAAVERKSEAAEKALYHTLDAMAAGGIRDHLGGGFHRYSTDRKWLVPHFEKMLYDNAQLATVYTAAYQATNKIEYREVVEELLGFILAEMTDPSGGFHSALDAETNEIEGEYYVWQKPEIENALGADASLFFTAYGLDKETPFEHGFVLHLPEPIEKLAVEQQIQPRELRNKLTYLRAVLLKHREKRQMPLKDDKILTSWNGLMISAFANAAAAFNRQQYLDAAQTCAVFLLTQVRDTDGRLYRTFRKDKAKLNAYLDDYAFLVEGLLTLYQVTRDEKWKNAAQRLTDDQIKFYWDKSSGGFYFTPHHHEQLLARTMNAYDSVIPSGNSVTVRNLIRLASITGEQKYKDHAKEVIDLFAPYLVKNPRGMTNMALAVSEFLDDRDYRPLAERSVTENSKPGQPTQSNDKEPDNEPMPKVGNRPLPPKQGQTGSSNASIPKLNDRVSAKAFLSTAELPAGRRSRIAISLDIQPNWHINQNPPSDDLLIPTAVTIKSKLGTKLTGLKYPKGKEYKVNGLDDAILVYEGKITIFGDLEIPETAAGNTEEFDLLIKYQACNNSGCERPKTLQFSAKVPVAEVGAEVKAINAKVFQAE